MKVKAYRVFDLIMAAFVAVLIISNVGSTKIVELGPFSFDGGTLLFPIAYIFGDVLVEVYGYARAKRVIWTGFIWIMVASGLFAIIDTLPAAGDYSFSVDFHNILGQTPRIVLGSLLGYLSGSFSNAIIMNVMRKWSGEKWLWARTIGSTLVGEFLDSAIFVSVAFAGMWSQDLLIAIVISNYVFKVAIEVSFTPITYLVINKLKSIEA